MFFDSPADITNLAAASGFSIFVLPHCFWPSMQQIYTVLPNEKNAITVDQVRAVQEFIMNKTSRAQFIFIHTADRLTESAANAFLKILEEPGQNFHLVFLTEHLSALLPTVLSRARIFILRQPVDFSARPTVSDEILSLSKILISSSGSDLVAFADSLTNAKDKTALRPKVLVVVETAIEILYKSYFLTKKPSLLSKLQQCLKLYDHLEKNGHIKLHLVADLVS